MLTSLLFVALTAASATAGILPEPEASSISGPWQVVAASVSTEREDKLLYQINDPRLVGRFITFSPEQVSSDLREAFGCTQPRWATTHTSLNTLLEQTLQRAMPAPSAPFASFAQAGQTARAFGLSSSTLKDQPVVVHWLACGSGSLGPLQQVASAPPGSSTWFAPAPQGQRYMLWYGDTVLTLKAVPVGTRTRPSFACHRARLAAERSICASNSLASLDNSLATAWADARNACERQPTCIRALRQQQQAWVKQRNQCGSNAGCLRQALRDRLEVLVATQPE